jgi:hypothetical protein
VLNLRYVGPGAIRIPYCHLTVVTLANFSQLNSAEASVFFTLCNTPSPVAVPGELHN